MDKKTTDIVAYLTWIGWIIAMVAGDKENSKFHLNQALVIMIFSLLSIIPCIGWVWAIIMVVCWFKGFFGALNGEENPVPVIGGIKIIKPTHNDGPIETEVQSSTNVNPVNSDESKTDL